MKTIGMIGGLSWHSSLQMYEYINNYIAAALGEYNCAKMVLANVNLQDVFITRKDEQEQVLLEGARQIEAAGCDFYIICSNTMEEDFYRGRLESKGLEVIVPQENDRAFIDKVLFEETGFGIVKEESSKEFYRIAEKLTASGTEGVILGCTEIGMLMQQEHTEIPLFDTTVIHGETAAKMAIE